MSVVGQVLTDPNVIDEVVSVTSLFPFLELPTAGLKLYSALLKSRKTAQEIDAITATYSAEAQKIADEWR